MRSMERLIREVRIRFFALAFIGSWVSELSIRPSLVLPSHSIPSPIRLNSILSFLS